MKKRILLINPPFYRLLGSHFNGISLGISYIGAVLRDNGHDVKIYNADFSTKGEYNSLREIFDNYNNYKEILKTSSHEIWDEIRNQVIKFSPDIVGITILTGTYKSAGNIARIVKQIDPKIIVVGGGTHPTILPEEILQDRNYDVVIRGEGEITFSELVDNLNLLQINGISYRGNNGEVIHNPDRGFISDLDTLPFPGRELYLHDPHYIDYSYIMTGRGCPFDCTFCASKKIWNQKVRFRSPENVVEELIHINNTYGTNFFYFVDDTFTLQKSRAKEICSLILKERLNITWICDTRIDTIDYELLKQMQRAGCIRIKLGVESGSDSTLKNIKKRITTNQVRSAVSQIRKVGIEFVIYLIIGFPDETRGDILKTLRFVEELNPNYVSLSIFTPYPGTEIYEKMVVTGKRLPLEHWEYFFHQSRDMVCIEGIDNDLLDACLKLNETYQRKRI